MPEVGAVRCAKSMDLNDSMDLLGIVRPWNEMREVDSWEALFRKCRMIIEVKQVAPSRGHIATFESINGSGGVKNCYAINKCNCRVARWCVICS